MRVRGVRINNRRKAFEVRTSTRRLLFPFSKVDPKPTASDPVVRVFVERYAEGATEISRPARGAAPLRKARAYLHDNYREPYSLDRIAELLNPPLRVAHLEEMLDTIASIR